MKEITIKDLKKLIGYDLVIDLDEERNASLTEGDKVYLGSYNQNIIYDENLAY